MKITELKKGSVIFLLINLQHTKIMKKEDHNAVPDSLLTKEFISQFKTEDDVSKFLSKLHSQVLEKMLEGEFEPIVVPKHESRGLSIERLVISLYAKGMSVSDIEEEMREIYEIELSTSAISIITNKVN